MTTDNYLKELSIKEAIEALQAGKLVILPTDTVYGIAGSALNSLVCQQIFEVKNRPFQKELIWQFADLDQVKKYVQWNEKAEKLAAKFWPGPLTFVLKKIDGEGSLGVRIADCPETLEIIRGCNFPLAIPSANPSNLPAAKSEREILDYFRNENRIAGYVLTEKLKYGTESTIIALIDDELKILRSGVISFDQIAAVFQLL